MRRIATEEAFATPEQMAAMEQAVAGGAHDADTPFWSMMWRGQSPFAQRVMRQLLDLEDERLTVMDAHGVDMHVLALTSPGVQSLHAPDAVALARRSNDLLAALIARRPTRFAGLATIAPQSPDAAAREIERAVATLGLNGVMVNSHTNDEYLDEPHYLPIFEAAHAMGVPIYIHPRGPSAGMAAPYRKYGLETAIWGYGAETGLHGVRILVSGLLDRFPGLKIVLGHMGEGIPYWLWRIDYMHRHGSGRPAMRRSVAETFRDHFIVTSSGMHSPEALRFCIDTLGADKLMWAIDYPYQETPGAVAFLDEIALTVEERAAFLHRNAERVFGIGP
ncbi:amidohydrolase [Sphingomonas baiyangensis]|uniref:Amidohydrolase n=2 Tax=Sphingomonas baiyangensis TaxID=2572576 RepID=A0A4U1L6Y0_9SPHN|nr:amidohydrolase [Sphingomonas baiyangensis]